MSKDSTSSTYAPNASPGLSNALSNLNTIVASPSSVDPPLAPPPSLPASTSTVLPDTPPTDPGHSPTLPPGSAPPRPLSPSVSDPERQLRRYSREVAETLLGNLPVEIRKGVEASLVARKKSV